MIAASDPHASAAPASRAAAVREAARILATGGVPGPEREARRLAAAALDIAPIRLIAEESAPVPAAQGARVVAWARRRAAGEPLARITGEAAFWSLDLGIDAAVLEPRADSEAVVEAALGYLQPRDRPWRIADLGTGSGCLLLALLAECPRADGVGLDADAAAVDTARRNAHRAGLAARCHWAVSDWAAALGPATLDLAIANPPYVRSRDLAALPWPVRGFDPVGALDGGSDGLAAYRRLIPALGRVLTDTGAAVLETSPDLVADVADLALAHGLAVDGIERDLAGNQRCVAMRPAAPRRPEATDDAWITGGAAGPAS